MASLETTRGRQVPAWQQANRYYQQPTDYIAEMQSRSQSATAPATRKRRNTNGSYKIQKGDTLSAIARRYGTSVQALAEANGIEDVNKIYIGDTLNIPGSNASSQRQQVRNNNTSNNTSSNGFTIEQQAAVDRYVSSLNNNNTSNNTSSNLSSNQKQSNRNSRNKINKRRSLAQNAALIPKLRTYTPEQRQNAALISQLKRYK